MTKISIYGQAIGLLAIALAHSSSQQSLFTAVLGGPTVTVIDRHLREGPGWTGFTMEVLFLVAVFSLLDTTSRWRDLTVIRGVPPWRWAAGRLGASAVGALVFLMLLMVRMGLAGLTGWRSGSLLSSNTVWDVELWAVELIGLAWFTLAINCLMNAVWWSFLATLFLLSLARFGGGVSPYIPLAQWMVGLHRLPGTLSITDGMLYLLGFTLFSCSQCSGRLSVSGMQVPVEKPLYAIHGGLGGERIGA